MKKALLSIFVLVLLLSIVPSVLAAKTIGVNVLLTDITPARITRLGDFGTVRDIIYEIDAVTMKVTSDQLAAIRALPFVLAANKDVKRNGAPIDTVSVTDFEVGLSTWNLDVINVTSGPGFTTRAVAQDGTGVYVAVLDTGLVGIWRQYFPEERIATEYAIAFGGGGGDEGWVSTQPNKWESDTNSHGTHVTSTILGYSLNGTPITGVAPMAKVIPVKVLNQNGSGWSSVIARGILYVAELKEGPLAGYPVVINMSLGGSRLDAIEQAAIDYAISKGVVIVASAGNSGTAGMGYPGAYEPVISVAASGWTGTLSAGYAWYAIDIAEPIPASEFYIAGFSSRELAGQDLDVTAPGAYVVGPYNTSMGQPSYYYLSGTSMSSPHVAGIVALMLQKNATLDAFMVEGILEAAALSIPPWTHADQGYGLITANGALSLVP